MLDAWQLKVIGACRMGRISMRLRPARNRVGVVAMGWSEALLARDAWVYIAQVSFKYALTYRMRLLRHQTRVQRLSA